MSQRTHSYNLRTTASGTRVQHDPRTGEDPELLDSAEFTGNVRGLHRNVASFIGTQERTLPIEPQRDEFPHQVLMSTPLLRSASRDPPTTPVPTTANQDVLMTDIPSVVATSGQQTPQTLHVTTMATVTTTVSPGHSSTENTENNITEMVIGEAASNAAQQQPRPTTGGLPDVREVLGNTSQASFLITSNLLNELSVVENHVWGYVGPRTVTTEFLTREVDVYTQLMFAVVARYYTNMQLMDFDARTLYFLHYIWTAHRGAPAQLNEYVSIMEAYQVASGEGLEVLFYELSMLMIPEAGTSAGGITNLLTPPEFNRHLGNLRNSYPEVVACYYLAGQLVHGGLSCISPVHPLISFDSGLSAYLNAFNRGRAMLTVTNIVMEVRAPTLPRASINSTGDTARIDSAPPAPVRRTTSVTTPIVPVYTGLSGTNRTPRVTTTNQLLAQGRRTTPIPAPSTALTQQPTRVLPAQSQGTFQSTIELIESLSRRVDEGGRELARLMAERAADRAEMQALRTTIASLTETVQALNGRLTTIDQSLAINVQRAAHVDLQDRVNLNRTLIVPAAETAQQIVSQGTQQAPMQGTMLQALIQDLGNFRTGDDVNQMVARVRTAYTTAGDANGAGNVINATIMNPMSRARVIQKLERYARRP